MAATATPTAPAAPAKSASQLLMDEVQSMRAELKALKSTPVYPTGATPEAVLGAPLGNAGADRLASVTPRIGEDSMSSRGYSFLRLIGWLSQQTGPENAKIEFDMHQRMRKSLVNDVSPGDAFKQWRPFTVMAPFATSYMPEQQITREFRHEMKSLILAGTDKTDQGEVAWMQQKMFQSTGNPTWLQTKDMSWLNDTLGGALVKPPEQGELIQLLRNQEALSRAGCTHVPLPPQGRLVYPRQTTPGTAYWLGESQTTTASTLGTGELTLSAKKLGVLIKVPNELIRFASPAAEALLRDDMTKDLALGMDLGLLEGLGGNTQPRGLIYDPLITTVESSATGTNGDSIVGQDIYKMVYTIQENNAEPTGWIMRPKTAWNYFMLRFSTVTPNDQAGGFLFDFARDSGQGMKPYLSGLPVTTSTQVSRSQEKGNADDLTYVLIGMFPDYIIAMFGAMEFSATSLGDTPFQNDQTWVRGIVTCDGGARHPAAFALMDNLVTQ